jgi:cation transport regulator ChaB
MKQLWFSASMAMVVAAFLALPSEAQKGKGGGKGTGKGDSFTPPGTSSVLPSGHGKSEPARPFEQPKSGNSLPQEIRDKLPPGLRDMPEDHPGLANHLRKLGYEKPAVDPLKPGSRPLPLESKPLPTGDKSPARPFDHPKSGNSLPQEVRDKLPPGLRDMPDNHPGLANHLRKMGLLKDHPAVDPIPPEVRSQLPPGLRDRPYDHPGVANHLGKLGWSIGEDGALVPPPTLTPPTPATQSTTPPGSFQPFGGLFRRR